MNIIETTFEKLPTKCLLIGFEGENLRATVRIDCSSVFAEYPNATPSLIVKPLFADAYPVVVDRNGTDVDWLITSEILSFTGDGEIQLVFYKDEVICKSAIAKIRVCRSLQVTGEMPDVVAAWIENANRKLAEVDAVIVSIDEMDATAHGLPEGSAPTAEVQDVDDHKRISLGIPAGATGATGAKGDKGDRGEVGATPQMGIGTVQTLPAGSEATASMSGTTENPLLNLGIPKGDQGVKGDRGEKGDTGATGATGATPDFSIGTVSTLPAGSSATAEITGTAENPVLSLGIPQGAQGIQGEKGEKGDPGEGVPTGGITGQVLAKASDTDYDTEWIHVAPVVKNEASGSIASFPDGAEMPVDEVTVQINPVQDLHGYDHPWPAGGGKNKCDGTAYSCVISSNIAYILNRTPISSPHTTTVNYGGAGFVAPVKAGQAYAMSSDAAGSAVFYWAIYASLEDITDRTKVLQSGSAQVTFTADYDGYVVFMRENHQTGQTVTWTYAQLELGSSATSFSPYSNICPITGWDGVKVTRTGKNLCDESNLLLAEGWTVTDGVYSGINTALHIAFSNGFPGMAFKPDTTYTVSLVFRSTTASKITVIGFNYTDGTRSALYVQDTVEHTVSFTSTSGKSVSNLLLSYGAGDKVYISQMQVEEGSTATAYEPYAGNTYDIALPTEAGTVYGGELTVNADGSGSLVVDRAKKILNGTEPYGTSSYASNENYAHMILSDMSNSKQNQGAIMCDKLSMNGSAPYSNSGVGIWQGGSNVWYICVKKELLESDNSAGMISWIASNRPEAVYYLAQPQTYSLSASQIRTLLGQNNIWADTGDVTVKYNADTKRYIDNKITQAIAAALNA